MDFRMEVKVKLVKPTLTKVLQNMQKNEKLSHEIYMNNQTRT